MKFPRHEYTSVFEKLNQNKDDGHSNHYIVVLNLLKEIQGALTKKSTSLDGVSFRTTLEGSRALLKTYPSRYTYAVRWSNHG